MKPKKAAKKISLAQAGLLAKHLNGKPMTRKMSFKGNLKPTAQPKPHKVTATGLVDTDKDGE